MANPLAWYAFGHPPRARLLPRRMGRIRSRHVWLGGIFGKLVFAVGGELDRNLFGWEAEPVDVLLDALDELKRIGKDIPLQYFDNIITLLERESRQILEDD